MPRSVKSQRLLHQLGVLAAFERGEELVLVGPTYALRNDSAVRVRLAFVHDAERQLTIGYASDSGGAWQLVESEPFSMRGLGYYERRLKRIGDFIENTDRGRRR